MAAMVSALMCVDKLIQCNDVNVTSPMDGSQQNDDCNFMMHQVIAANKCKLEGL